MNFSRIKLTGPVVAALLLFPASALAQYNPNATLDLGMGMGSIALGQSTLSGTRQIGKGEKGSDELSPTMKRYCAKWPNESVCRADRTRRLQRQQQSAQLAPGRVNQLMAQLFPEYEQRIRRDGKARADQWLRETAFRLGQQEGRTARRSR